MISFDPHNYEKKMHYYHPQIINMQRQGKLATVPELCTLVPGFGKTLSFTATLDQPAGGTGLSAAERPPRGSQELQRGRCPGKDGTGGLTCQVPPPACPARGAAEPIVAPGLHTCPSFNKTAHPAHGDDIF